MVIIAYDSTKVLCEYCVEMAIFQTREVVHGNGSILMQVVYGNLDFLTYCMEMMAFLRK